MGLMFTA